MVGRFMKESGNTVPRSHAGLQVNGARLYVKISPSPIQLGFDHGDALLA